MVDVLRKLKLFYEYYDRTGKGIIVMAKVMNLGAHCSECIHYQGIRSFMYCMALQKRITARKTPKYCNHYKKNKI